MHSSLVTTGLAYYFQPNRNAIINHFGTLGLASTGVETGLSKQDMCSEWNSRSSFFPSSYHTIFVLQDIPALHVCIQAVIHSPCCVCVEEQTYSWRQALDDLNPLVRHATSCNSTAKQ